MKLLISFIAASLGKVSQYSLVARGKFFWSSLVAYFITKCNKFPKHEYWILWCLLFREDYGNNDRTNWNLGRKTRLRWDLWGRRNWPLEVSDVYLEIFCSQGFPWLMLEGESLLHVKSLRGAPNNIRMILFYSFVALYIISYSI